MNTKNFSSPRQSLTSRLEIDGRENAEAISAGAAKSYEQIMESWGARFVGESQVLPGHVHQTGSTDDGVNHQS